MKYYIVCNQLETNDLHNTDTLKTKEKLLTKYIFIRLYVLYCIDQVNAITAR